MAMIQCRECKREISSEASTCPGCGIKSPAKKPGPGVLGWTLAIASSLLIYRCITFQQVTASAPPPPDPVAEARFKMVAIVMAAIKQDARDPDSIIWDSARSSTDGNIICIEYRAKNGFGGTNREFVVMANGEPRRNKADDWNKHCTASLHDELKAKYAVK